MRIILVTILALSTISLFAQQDRGMRGDGSSKYQKERMYSEKLEAQKISFFSTKLDLSPDEAQMFWPLYNEYEKQKRAFRNTRRNNKPNIDDLDDAQSIALLDEFLNNKQNELDLDKAYAEKFTEVLPAQKVFMVFILERWFKEEMLKDVRRRLNDSK